MKREFTIVIESDSLVEEDVSIWIDIIEGRLLRGNIKDISVVKVEYVKDINE